MCSLKFVTMTEIFVADNMGVIQINSINLATLENQKQRTSIPFKNQDLTVAAMRVSANEERLPIPSG